MNEWQTACFVITRDQVPESALLRTHGETETREREKGGHPLAGYRKHK